jgi:type IV pilus assembly protein PilB
MDIAVTRVPQDGRFTARISGREINVRVSSLPTIYGENIVMRLLDMNALVFKLDQLGMRESDVRKISQTIERPHGMILNTGPTGSGKTTTLYSVLAMLNRPEVNIITVEDPVEYRIPRIRQVELNTRAGMTFAGSLRSMLRQDPDIAMIGEIRDSETATIAIQAALTGHLVLSTVHTNNAIGTISRLIDMGIEPFLIASVLSCVIGQRLVRRVCPSCAEPWSPPPEVLGFWGLRPDSESQFVKARGCHRCRHTGYRGRVGVYEVLPISENLQSLIASRASEADLRAAAREEGNFVTMREDAAIKIQKGMTTLQEAAAKVVL